jgi:tetratricopeptide (TPR) repeat protein
LALRQADFTTASVYYRESRVLQQELGDRAVVAESCYWLATLAQLQGAYEEAQARAEECLALQHELGNRGGMALALSPLGEVAYKQGAWRQAQAYLEESLEVREVQDEAVLAWDLHLLGGVYRQQRDLAVAERALAESLAVYQEVASAWGVAVTQESQARIAAARGAYAEAARLGRASLGSTREQGDRLGQIYGVEQLAQVAAGQGQAERAARLLGAAGARRAALGTPVPPASKPTWPQAER